MKKLFIQSALFLLLPLLVLATNHLTISEIVLQPSAGEYVRITNSTDATVNLGNYYLSDATDKTAGKYYYNITTGADYWSGASTDFIARFPDMNLATGASLILGLGRVSDYFDTYGANPDLALKETMLNAVDGVTTIGSSPNVKLDNTAEGLILFKWDGTASTVQDVEYLIWGTDSTTASAYMIDKTGVSSYLADTPVAAQSYMETHLDGYKLVRNSDEGTETTSNGNGISGHDETSENLADTWSMVDLTIAKPEITNMAISPNNPETGEILTVSADVTDVDGLSSVTLTYTFPSATGTPTDVEMTNSSSDTYTVTIPAINSVGTLACYITAINTNDLRRVSQLFGADIVEPLPPLTIETIRGNMDIYLGQVVELNAVVSVGSGILRVDRTDMYIQDNSGFGINLSQTGLLNPALVQGDSISITATVGEYNGAIQLQDFVYDVLATNRPIPNIAEISTADLNTLLFEARFVKISGQVSSRADNIGGGSNIVVEDGFGQVTLRVWDTANIWADATADSLLQIGNLVDVWGIAAQYNGEGQMNLAYGSDVQAHPEGIDGTGTTVLTVAPYAFDPLRGEKIKYSISFPENAHITVRIFDLSGRIITTLFDGYRSLALEIDNLWDGRTETYAIVVPGTYIMHLETVNRRTGETLQDMAPVVIATAVN
jgi:DNA/RNA endonuclease YhcR with UshA esterase domain